MLFQFPQYRDVNQLQYTYIPSLFDSLLIQVTTDHRKRRWRPTPVLLPGKSPGWRSLVGCSPWGHEESDTTERLPFHLSRSCIGEGNGNPLQRSCLENPRDGGAWSDAIYGVTQSRTRLKRLSSSNRPPGSSLCCTGRFHQLSVLFIVSIVCMCQSHSPNSSYSWCAYVCSLHLSLFPLCKQIHLYHFS